MKLFSFKKTASREFAMIIYLREAVNEEHLSLSRA